MTHWAKNEKMIVQKFKSMRWLNNCFYNTNSMVDLICTFFRYFGTLCMTIDNALIGVVKPKKDIFSLKLVKVSDGNPIWTFFTGPHPKYSRGGLNLLLELLHLPLQNCTKQFFYPLQNFFQSDLQEIINALYDMV